jgi:hypothetical protein
MICRYYETAKVKKSNFETNEKLLLSRIPVLERKLEEKELKLECMNKVLDQTIER